MLINILCIKMKAGYRSGTMPEPALRCAIAEDIPDIRALTLAAYARWIGVAPQSLRPVTVDYDRAFREHRFDLLVEDGALIALLETAPQRDRLIVNVAIGKVRGTGCGWYGMPKCSPGPRALLDLPATVPLSPARSRFADFLRRRRQLVDMHKAEKLHRHSAGQPEIASAIEIMIDLLGQQIATLDRQIAGFFAEDQALSEQARLLTAVPGTGPTVLAALLGELPELGTLCRRKIASLAGLAPHAGESGTWCSAAAYGAAGERSARPFISPLSMPHAASPSSSPSHDSYSSSSTP